jgi:hypothetical protein
LVQDIEMHAFVITAILIMARPPCRLVRQGAEIWVERRAFPPKSPVPATKVAGDGTIMRIADPSIDTK